MASGGAAGPGAQLAPAGATASTTDGLATWTWPPVETTVLMMSIDDFRAKFLTPDGQLNMANTAHRVKTWKQAALDLISGARTRGELRWPLGQMSAFALGGCVEGTEPRKDGIPSRLDGDEWQHPSPVPDVWLVLNCCRSRDESCPCPAAVRLGFWWADLLNRQGGIRTRGEGVPIVVEPYAPNKLVPKGCVHRQHTSAPTRRLRGATASGRDEAAAQKLSGHERSKAALAAATGACALHRAPAFRASTAHIAPARARAAATLLRRRLARADEAIEAGAVALPSKDADRKAKQRAEEELYRWGTLEVIAAESRAQHEREVKASQAANPYAGRVHTRFFPGTIIMMLEEGIRALRKVRELRAARARSDSRAACGLRRVRFRLDRTLPCDAWPTPCAACAALALRVRPCVPCASAPSMLRSGSWTTRAELSSGLTGASSSGRSPAPSACSRWWPTCRAEGARARMRARACGRRC